MKKALKWLGIAALIMVILGIVAIALESPEDKAAREAQTAQLEAERAAAKAEADAKKAEADAAKAAEQAEKDKQKELRGLMVEHLTLCEMAIKPQLRNQKSMDKDWDSISHQHHGETYEIRFAFNAENAYGGQVTHRANCLIDKDKNLLQVNVR